MLNTNTNAERLYNEAHIRTRVKIENLFGVWKRRFPILAYGCRLKLDTTLTVIVATAVLHNIARRQHEPEPPVEEHILQLLANGQIPNVPDLLDQRAGAGFDLRNEFIHNYFRLLQ